MTSEIQPSIAYYNARVRGMRSELLARKELEDMLEQGDVQRMIDRLLDSLYRREMAEALTRRSGADAIEEALLRNIAATYNKLVRMAQGDFRDLVVLFLRRWDLAAVKSLLRAKHHGLDADTGAAALIPGPALTLPVLNDLIQLDSVEQIVSALAGWDKTIAKRMRNALPEYQESRDLRILEEVIDEGYFVATVEVLAASGDPNAQMLCEELRGEVDKINLRMVFRSLDDEQPEASVAKQALPAGKLTVATLKRVAASGNVAGAMEALAATRYDALAEEMYQFLQTGRFSPVERYFDRVRMQRLRRQANNDVFGISVLMDYVWRKYNEVINLRLIARGLSGHLPKGRVREELYFQA